MTASNKTEQKRAHPWGKVRQNLFELIERFEAGDLHRDELLMLMTDQIERLPD
jgi:hypothetical protein